MVSSNDVTMATDIQFAREGGAGMHTVTIPDLTSARIITEALQRAGYSVNLRGAAERMPEDVQKLVDEAREVDAELWHDGSPAENYKVHAMIVGLIAALEAAYSQTGAVDEPR